MPEYKRTNGGKKAKKPNKFLSFIRIFSFWLIILLFISLFFGGTNGAHRVDVEEKTISEIHGYAVDGKLEKIVVQGDTLTATPKEGEDLKTMVSRKDPRSSLYEQGFADVIDENKVAIEVVEDIDMLGIILNVASIAVPVILLGAFLIYMLPRLAFMATKRTKFSLLTLLATRPPNKILPRLLIF